VIGGESLTIALRGIMANKLRSALTMLGILIGVGAVIVLVAVGTGSSTAVQKRIDSLGTNTITIFRGFSRGANGRASTGTQSSNSFLTPVDVQALSDPTQAPDVKSVSPVVNATVTATWQGSTYSPSSFVGSTPSIEEASNYQVASGTFFTQSDLDQHNQVAVVGQTVIKNLFGGANPIGQQVQFNRSTFTIIGTLKSKGSNGFQDQDDVVVAPLTAVQDNLTGITGSYSSIIVEAKSRGVQNSAEQEVSTILDGTHNVTNPLNPNFRVLNQASLLATSQSSSKVFTVLLGAVAAISLLVGGIGVMNIMLVTVTERTREIGIRKAIGAKKADILGQFMTEAVLLTVLGGLFGVVAGLIGSQFRIVGVQPVVQLYSVALAFGVALCVGLFFGIYPANRAASLRPIEALRYE
jgi:putative ABC transport system permease protein